MPLTKIDDRGLTTPIDFLDNEKVRLGTGNDLEIFHSGTDSFIQNYSGDLNIRGVDGKWIVIQAKPNENSIICKEDGAVELYFDNSKKIATTADGADCFNRFRVLGGTAPQIQFNSDSTGADTSTRAMLGLATGSNNFINGSTTGDIVLNTPHRFIVGHATGELMAVFDPDGESSLFYDNSLKIKTTSGGIEVTGGINLSTNLSLVDDGILKLGTGDDLRMVHNGSHSYIEHFGTGDLYFGTTSNAPDADIMLITNSTTRWQVTGASSNAGHLKPAANNTYDIGTTSNRVRNIYTNDLNLSNEGSSNDVDGTWGDWTIQEGESDLFLKNNRSGKKYKFNLTEVS